MSVRNKIATTVMALSLALPAAGVAHAQQNPDCKKPGQCENQKPGKQAAPQKKQQKQPAKKQPAKKQQQSSNWQHKGGKMPKSVMGPAVDYKKHNLRKPPEGHRWVKVNGEYVLVAISTGIIASIIAATN